MRAAGLFAIAVAIAFYAWWPGYKVELYVADCTAQAVAKVNKATADIDDAKAKSATIRIFLIDELDRAESELFEIRQRCIKEANLLFR